MSDPKFTQARPIVNFPEVESSIQRFWQENGIFEKSLKNREGCPKFVFYEGPPTANGIPHNGHVLTRVIKDIFLRYRTMRGYYVPRKAGWDTHGLPVEVEVEKELGIHGKEAIEKYGVERFVLRCMQSVFRYTEEWEGMTNRVGFWVDLSDAYVTYHRSYVESVWWALSELFRKGLLYQGHKIVWWWPQGGTALSSGEVGLGYKTVDDPSVYVALPLEDEPDTSLLVWTTTPWTLPANQYVAVHPDYDYVQVQEDGRSLVVAAALRETIAEKIGRELPVEKEFKGEALLGRRYRPPLDYFLWAVRESRDRTSRWGAGTADVDGAGRRLRRARSGDGARSRSPGVRRGGLRVVPSERRPLQKPGRSSASVSGGARRHIHFRHTRPGGRLGQGRRPAHHPGSERERGVAPSGKLPPRLPFLLESRGRSPDSIRASGVVHSHDRKNPKSYSEQREDHLVAGAHRHGTVR